MSVNQLNIKSLNYVAAENLGIASKAGNRSQQDHFPKVSGEENFAGRSRMKTAQRIYEMNLETNNSVDDELYSYGDMSDFEVLDGDSSESIFQDTRAKKNSDGSPINQDDPLNFDGGEFGGAEEVDGKSLKNEIQKFEATAVAKNPNLSDDEKKDYQLKLERWVHSIDLQVGGLDQVEADFQSLQEEVAAAGNFPISIRKLGQTSGKDPEEVQLLLKKHGLNPRKLPPLTDARISALLNDPEFSDRLPALKEAVLSATQNLSNEIDKQSQVAKDENAKSQHDKEQRSQDDTSYRFLYDAHFHQDEKSQALIEARRQLAAETAVMLTALYGKEVTAEASPEKAGLISLGSTSVNLPFASSSEVGWPKVNVIPFEVHHEGSRQAKIPDWIAQANYPMNTFDEYSWRDNAWQWGMAFLGGGVISTGMQYLDWNNHGRQVSSGGEIKNVGLLSSETATP